MRKIIMTMLSICIVLSVTGCTNQKVDTSIDVDEMKNIAELATLKVYYHNVAKYDKHIDTGWKFWKASRKHFWIEYSGYVDMGIDIDNLKITLKGNEVRIKLPEVTIIDYSVDESSLNDDSYYVDKGSAKITSEDEIEAFVAAQKNMVEIAKKDSSSLKQAKLNAKELLENYVNAISELTEKQYTVTWQED